MTERCRYCKESFGLHLLDCPLNVRTVASVKPSTSRRGRVPREGGPPIDKRASAVERQRRYRERNRDTINAARRADNWERPKGRPLGRPKKSA